MKAWIGKSVIAIGLIHSGFGLVVFRDILAVVAAEGLLNTVNGQPDRERAFWFLFTGLVWLILGGLVDWLERRGDALPAFLAWTFLVMTAVGVLIMPLSGFWLLWVPTAGLFRRQRLRRRAPAG